MATTPAVRASLTLPEKGPDSDFIHFVNSAGQIVSWIDSNGVAQGNVAQATQTVINEVTVVLGSVDQGTF